MIEFHIVSDDGAFTDASPVNQIGGHDVTWPSILLLTLYKNIASEKGDLITNIDTIVGSGS